MEKLVLGTKSLTEDEKKKIRSDFLHGEMRLKMFLLQLTKLFMDDYRMVIFLDSGYFVAFINEDDSNHERANYLFDDLVGGTYSTRITTDIILDEALTVTWVRTKRKKFVADVYSLLIGKEAIVLLHSFPHDLIVQAWEIFEKYSDEKRPLSYTDCVNIIFCQKKNIDYILSFYSELDGILPRIY